MQEQARPQNLSFANSMNDNAFVNLRNQANPTSIRNNEGWVVYQYSNSILSTRVTGNFTKNMSVEGGISLNY